MDLRIALGLVGVGIAVGFAIRSSLRFLFKVAIILVALAAFHIVSPEGIPDMLRQGFGWVVDKVGSEAKDALSDR